MENYIPISLKYRPQNFAEISGHHIITTSLRNMIKTNRIANAYIFAGPRGVGKTSLARVFAKAINCKNRSSASLEPCNTCNICVDITRGSCVDVIEIDAASNRGIDEIRNLEENLRYKTLQTNYKVYILDEAHMITPEAWNAFLKTLEEPPPHVKFIFATTEPGKLPKTVQSRCQRFDFHNLSSTEITKNLKKICEKENIAYTDAVLEEIAIASEGSLRDAQVLLEQLYNYTGSCENIDYLYEMLGTTPESKIRELFSHVFTGNLEKSIAKIKEITQRCWDTTPIIKGAFKYISKLLNYKTNQQVEKLSEEEKKLVDSVSVETLLYCSQVLIKLKEEMRDISADNFLLEVAILKMLLYRDSANINKLIQKVEQIINAEKVETPRISQSQYEPETYKPVSTKSIERVEKTNKLQDSETYKTEEKRQGPSPKEPVESVSSPVNEVKSAENDIFEHVKNKWNDILAAIRDTNNPSTVLTQAWLSEGYPYKLQNNQLIIRFPDKCRSYIDVLDNEARISAISKAITKSVGCKFKLVFELEPNDMLEKKNEPLPIFSSLNNVSKNTTSNNQEIPLIVKKASQLFNGRIYVNK